MNRNRYNESDPSTLWCLLNVGVAMKKVCHLGKMENRDLLALNTKDEVEGYVSYPSTLCLPPRVFLPHQTPVLMVRKSLGGIQRVEGILIW